MNTLRYRNTLNIRGEVGFTNQSNIPRWINSPRAQDEAWFQDLNEKRPTFTSEGPYISLCLVSSLVFTYYFLQTLFFYVLYYLYQTCYTQLYFNTKKHLFSCLYIVLKNEEMTKIAISKWGERELSLESLFVFSICLVFFL